MIKYPHGTFFIFKNNRGRKVVIKIYNFYNLNLFIYLFIFGNGGVLKLLLQ